MEFEELKDFLDEKVSLYNTHSYIESDPICVPHSFDKKEDIEISAFLTATISWGNRKMIIKNAWKMMELLDNSPHDFILNHSEKDLKRIDTFVHRTFNSDDLKSFVRSLKHLYSSFDSLEVFFTPYKLATNLHEAINDMRQYIISSNSFLERSKKHISNPMKNSATKRIHMFLRWMVRRDNAGVDFGIWNTVNPCQLSCPLDIHSGRVARMLGLLHRKQNDLKAVCQLDAQLRLLDPKDPAKYDYALFGLGIFEKWK